MHSCSPADSRSLPTQGVKNEDHQAEAYGPGQAEERSAGETRAYGAESREGLHWALEPVDRAEASGFARSNWGAIYFVVKNCGPNNVMLMAQNGDLMDLAPGAVRATYAHGTINVENRGEKPVLIEFDFLPIHRRW